MNFDINEIKIGDKVRLGPKNQKPQAYGIVRKIDIQVTMVHYNAEITHFPLYPKTVGSVRKFTHHVIKKEDNDPDMIMKSIL